MRSAAGSCAVDTGPGRTAPQQGGDGRQLAPFADRQCSVNRSRRPPPSGRHRTSPKVAPEIVGLRVNLASGMVRRTCSRMDATFNHAFSGFPFALRPARDAKAECGTRRLPQPAGRGVGRVALPPLKRFDPKRAGEHVLAHAVAVGPIAETRSLGVLWLWQLAVRLLASFHVNQFEHDRVSV